MLQKSLKVWVKCDHFEALDIEMHVHTWNLNTDPKAKNTKKNEAK